MEKKKVLIDLGKLKNLYVGLGQVSLRFGKVISEIEEDNLEWHFLLPPTWEKEFPTTPYVHLSTARRWFAGLNKGFDLWHALHQDSMYCPPKQTPYLLTIHDLNFLNEKEPYKAGQRLLSLQKKVNNASGIAVISKYTFEIINSYLQIPSVPVKIIYNGSEQYQGEEKKPSWLGDKPFFFTISVIKPKKNFHVLVDVMAQMHGYNMIIAGDDSDPYAKKIRSDIQKKGLSDRVILPGKITDAEKAYLYRNCTAFFFPSMFEGFGLPVVEAMQHGKPVFLANYSSLPEIGGNMAYYWQHFQPLHMREIIEKGLVSYQSDSTRPDTLRKYAARFSWEKNVREYIAYYKEILQL